MIRIIYEWRVDPDNLPEFHRAWKETTRRIHDSVKGARGSFLLQEEGDPGRILTIARWDTVDDWKAFWKGENPPAMQKMRNLGERISVKVYEEYADFTV